VGRILDAVRAALETDGWELEPVEELPGAVRALVQGRGGHWTCLICTDEEREVVVVYSILPRLVPAEARPAAMERVTSVNFGAPIGNLELSLITGEVRYKTSASVEGLDPLPLVFLRNLVDANVNAMNRHYAQLAELTTMPDGAR
jgi:hypothetical protein